MFIFFVFLCVSLFIKFSPFLPYLFSLLLIYSDPPSLWLSLSLDCVHYICLFSANNLFTSHSFIPFHSSYKIIFILASSSFSLRFSCILPRFPFPSFLILYHYLLRLPVYYTRRCFFLLYPVSHLWFFSVHLYSWTFILLLFVFSLLANLS